MSSDNFFVNLNKERNPLFNHKAIRDKEIEGALQEWSQELVVSGVVLITTTRGAM